MPFRYACCKPEENQVAGDEGEHIGKSIPARADVVVNPKDNRVETVQVIGEHPPSFTDVRGSRNENARHPERSEGPPKRD